MPEQRVPLRILMVSYNTPPWHFAGAGNQAVLLSKYLIEMGESVTLITASAVTMGWTNESLETIPIVRLWSPRHKILRAAIFNLLSILWWLRHGLAFDIVHIHGCTHLTTLIWIVLARLWGKKCLLKTTCQDVDDLSGIAKYPVVGTVAAAIARQAHGFIAMSPVILEDYKHHGLESKTFLIPNGVDPKHFYPVHETDDKQQLRRKLGLPENGLLLIYTGGINPRKNVKFLVEVLYRLKPEFSDISLCLVGPCKEKFQGYREELIKEIETLNLQDSVIFTGEVPYPQTALYLQASDIFVFASMQEGLGTSWIEALACGLPAVISELPGITDGLQVDTEPAALIMPQGDALAFSKAVSGILNNRTLYESLSVTAIKHFANHFELAAIADRYNSEVYPKLLPRRG